MEAAGIASRSPKQPEAARLADVYGRYRDSGRHERAWSATNRGNTAMRAELERAVAGSGVLYGLDRQRVLDLGCGHGYWLGRLAARGAPPENLVGVEILPDRAAAATRSVAGRATVVSADAIDLPFGDGRFDLVLLFTVLSSVLDKDRARRILEEAHRVLRSGGHLLVYEPRVPNPLNRHTRHVGLRDLEAVLGRPVLVASLTVLPPLSRRLGFATGRLYPLLARLPPLRTHRLLVYGGT